MTAERKSSRGSGGAGRVVVGVDVGATLAKIAAWRDGHPLELRLLEAGALDVVADTVEALEPDRIGVTGGGGPLLLERLSRPAQPVPEFEAWAAGARALLVRAGLPADGSFLVVSLGTGTSVLLANGAAVHRVGGTALGGGTLMGLGALFVPGASFDELARLAAKGDRRRIDLLVSDIYTRGERPLAGDLTAASFGKLARDPSCAAPEDLAHALMGLVGENVALICGALVAATQPEQILFAGSTLRGNPALVNILCGVAGAFGRPARHLPDGEFAAALGAVPPAAG